MIRLAPILLSLLAFSPAFAQVVPAPQGTAAMVCANNTVVPTPSNGKFFYVQCDATGKLITSSAGGGAPSGPAGGGLTGTYPNPTVASVPATALPAFTGDCTTSAGTSATTCTKTGGVAFGPFATATVGQMPGITTNTPASAGNVGEATINNRESGSALSLTTSTALTVASVSLTSGNWEISGNACWDIAGTTTVSLLMGVISANNNSISGAGTLNQARLSYNAAVLNGTTCITIPRQVVYLSGTTTYYLNSFAIFGTSTVAGYGSIVATRPR